MDPDYDEAESEIEAMADDAKIAKAQTETQPAAQLPSINVSLPEWAFDRALEATGERLARDAKEAVAKIVAKRVAEICDETFIAEVTKRAHDATMVFLDKPRTRTNEWGESLGGSAVTWSENIPKSVEAYLNAPVDRDGNTQSYGRENKGTRLSWLLQKHVTDQLKVETEKAAKSVTEQARAIVANHVGRFISEQMMPAIDVTRIENRTS